MTQETIFNAAFDAAERNDYEELERIIREKIIPGQKLQDRDQLLLSAIGVLANHDKPFTADDAASRIKLSRKIIDIIDINSLSDDDHFVVFSGVLNSRGTPKSLDTSASIAITKHLIDSGFKVENLSSGKDAFQVVAEQSSTSIKESTDNNQKIAYEIDLAMATLLLETGKVPGLEEEKGAQAIEAIRSGKCKLRNFVEEFPNGNTHIKTHKERGEFLETVLASQQTSAAASGELSPGKDKLNVEDPGTVVKPSRSLFERLFNCFGDRNK